MAIPSQITFALSEYLRRWSAVKSNMETLKVDALVTFRPHNVTYLTGMNSENLTSYQSAVLTLDSETPTLIILEFERARSENSSIVEDVRTYQSFDDLVLLTLERLRTRPEIRRVALDRTTLTPDQYVTFTDGLFEFEIVDGFGLVEDARLIKSTSELELMDIAASLTDVGMSAGVAAIKVGAEDREVAAAAVSAMYRAGSDTIYWGPVVASGYRSGTAHSTFNGHRIARGESVFLELTGVADRYVSPLMRTVVIGEPSRDMLEAESAVTAALDTIVDTAAAGVPANLVAENGVAALDGVLSQHIFHNYFGYPVGIGYPPTWMESLAFFIRTDNERSLKAGMVFHLPISLRRYGEYGINLSHTIVIEDDGARILGGSPARLLLL